MMRRLGLKRLAALLTLVALPAVAAHAQESAFQDADGGSSIFLRDGGGFARVNPTEKSIELGFMRDTGREKLWFGIDFKGKASGNFASLFNGGTPSPEAEVGLTVGKRFIFMKSDAEVQRACTDEKVKELTSPAGLPGLIETTKEMFIARRKMEHLNELTKNRKESLTASFENDLFREKKARGLSDLVARRAAELEAPELVQTQLEKEAEEMAKADAETQEGMAQIRKEAVSGAEGEASVLCVLNPATLDARAYDWLTFRAAYKRARYKILDESAAFADQVRKQNFDGFSATLAYNRVITLDDLSAEGVETANGSKGSFVIGASIGVERRNNSDGLNSVELEDQSFTASSETTQRRAVSKQTVLSGEYKEFTAVPLNTDVVWFPGSLGHRVAIDFFTRSNLSSTDRKFVPGVGLFLTKEGSPTKVVGGISFSVDDGKGKVGLVGGFNF